MSESTQASHAHHADPCVHLLWTGGWDSTFQLLRLLLRYRIAVTPHYLKDPTRASTQVELQTMQRIGDRVRAAYPHTHALLRPLRIAEVAGLPRYAEIDAALDAIRRRAFIGSQYAWLAAYCRQRALPDMELGVHVDDKVQALLQPLAAGFAHDGGYRSVRVDRVYVGSAEFTLFGGYSFPLFHLDKRAMDAEARAEGWDALMDMTWFCHRPLRGRPCGLCAPCVYTIEEGLARRVPASRRALSLFYRKLAWPLKDPLRRLRASWRGPGRT